MVAFRSGASVRLTFMRDVTDTLTSELYRQRDAQFKTAMSTSGLASWTYDVKEGRQDWSPGMKEMFGITEEYEAQYLNEGPAQRFNHFVIFNGWRRYLKKELVFRRKREIAGHVPQVPAGTYALDDGRNGIMRFSGSISMAGGDGFIDGPQCIRDARFAYFDTQHTAASLSSIHPQHRCRTP